jgi:hypothetical protein
MQLPNKQKKMVGPAKNWIQIQKTIFESNNQTYSYYSTLNPNQPCSRRPSLALSLIQRIDVLPLSIIQP